MIHLSPTQPDESFYWQGELLSPYFRFLSALQKTLYLGSFALLCQVAGQELMLTAPLTRAALLKLTRRPSITK